MNQHFDAVPHIIRDEEDGINLNLRPYECHCYSSMKRGALALISIYIDTRDEDEATDEGWLYRRGLNEGNYY